MIREPLDVDFYTTGRTPSEEEFKRISEAIRKLKEKAARAKERRARRSKKTAL